MANGGFTASNSPAKSTWTLKAADTTNTHTRSARGLYCEVSQQEAMVHGVKRERCHGFVTAFAADEVYPDFSQFKSTSVVALGQKYLSANHDRVCLELCPNQPRKRGVSIFSLQTLAPAKQEDSLTQPRCECDASILASHSSAGVLTSFNIFVTHLPEAATSGASSGHTAEKIVV